MTVRPILLPDCQVRALLAGRKTQHRLIIKTQPGCVSAFPYACGDLLWVREAHMPGYYHDPDALDGVPKVGLTYTADNTEVLVPAPSYDLAETWRRCYSDDGPDDPVVWSAARMPRWASRLTLEVTAVRVERLQDITEADAQAEGAPWEDCWPTYRQSFESLWTSIHGPGAWEANPWVAATTFAVHNANVNALLAQRAAPARDQQESSHD